MKKTTKRSKTDRQPEPQAPAPAPAPDIAKILSEKQPILHDVAMATVRCMRLFMNAVRTRATVAAVLVKTSNIVIETANGTLEGKWLMTEESFQRSQLDYTMALSGTQHLADSFTALNAQLRDLDKNYQQVKSVNGIVAFRALRAISRGLLQHDRENWEHVLRAWSKLNPEAVRIARWMPSNEEDKFAFRFDDATKKWIGEAIPEFLASVAAYTGLR